MTRRSPLRAPASRSALAASRASALVAASAIVFVFLLLSPFADLARAENIKTIHPTGYVTDLAGVLSQDSKARLESLCTELQQKTGAQMAIVTVHSLEGESVDDYAVDLFKQLGVGSKQTDRGVLLLLAPDERKYRIEVGYGLEPVINDARAGDAGRAMVPFLRQRNYSGAVESAAWTLANYVAADRGVTLSGHPPAQPHRDDGDNGGDHFPWPLIVIALILFSVIRRIGRSGGGRRGGGFGSGWWIGPMIGGGMRGGGWGGGFGGGSGGFGSGGGFGGFGGGMSGGGGASGGW